MLEYRNPTTNETTALVAGCYVDGHWGQYGASRVLRIADDITGSTLYEDTASAMDAQHAEDVANKEKYPCPASADGIATDELPGCEIVSEAADEAETALTAGTTGGYWGWHDGGFFLTETHECIQCGEMVEGQEGEWFAGVDSWFAGVDSYECAASADGGPHKVSPWHETMAQ